MQPDMHQPHQLAELNVVNVARCAVPPQQAQMEVDGPYTVNLEPPAMLINLVKTGKCSKTAIIDKPPGAVMPCSCRVHLNWWYGLLFVQKFAGNTTACCSCVLLFGS